MKCGLLKSLLRTRFAFTLKAQTIDFQPVLAGEVYGPLQDPDLFNRVEIDPEARMPVWPNGADFDPATLHDWPEYEDEMREMARRWAHVKA
ncbi:MAG: DUF2442 domain-containing protein [Bryobacteraceae bacterium]